MKKILKSILIIAVVILMNAHVYATTGKITYDTVRIRKEANTDSEVLTVASLDDEVEIIEKEGDWYKVKYSEFTGYIRNDMLEVKENTENSEAQETSENKEETAQNQENTSDSNASNVETKNEEEKVKIDSSYTISSKIDLKIIPSINSSVVASISENNTIQVKDIINKWCYVENGTSSGWVLKSKIVTNSQDAQTETKNEEAVEETAEENSENKENEEKEEPKKEEKETNITKYVAVSTLNLRKEASNSSEVIEQLNLNTKVTITATVDNTWGKVTFNGKTGYVAMKHLSDSKTAVTSRSETANRESSTSNEESSSSSESSSEEETSSSESSGSTTGAAVVAYAKQFLGCSYVYGGTTPSGFDCSGFTSYVYRHFGYSLNRTSSGQRSNGVAVDKSNLKAGDILCFSGHVGIYIGGGSFIHAANPSKGVIISSLSESYYTRNYITARRIL